MGPNPLGIGVETITMTVRARVCLAHYDGFASLANLIEAGLADNLGGALGPGSKGFVIRHAALI